MRTPPDLGTADAPYAALGPAAPRLEGDRDAEVVVVGGGLVGATTALLLAERGHEVVLIEAHRIAGGTSGRSTGKVTSQHGAIYTQLVQRHGHEVAQVYASENQAAITTIEAIAGRHGIDCQLEPVATYMHALTGKGADQLRREADVARTLGLPATLTSDAPVPDAVRAGLRYDDQRQFDPRAYTMGVAAAARAQGATLHEHTPLRKVRPRRGGVQVTTDHGVIAAEHVVLAMLTPWPDVVGAFARATPSRAACIAVELDGPVPTDPSLGVDGPSRSTRRLVPPASAPGDGDGERLVLLSSGWRPGGTDEAAVLEELADEAFHRWGARRVTHHWAAMDQVSADALPLVGALPGLPRILAASGFSKWGMTGGTVAAELLVRRIRGEASDSPFDAARFPDAKALGKILAANLRDGYELARHRVPVPGTPTDLGDLAPGEGRVVATLTGPVAVSADASGRPCAVSASCTHLGCTVRWNRAGGVWECACHGSRFGPDGEVLGGPATSPLAPRELPGDPS